MKEQINTLLELADIDSEIHSLQEIKEARPQQLAPVQAQLDQKTSKLSLVQQELRNVRKESDKTEQAIKGLEEKINEKEIRLNSAKSNEEFNVLREEIKKAHAEISDKEEAGLDFLNKIEEFQKEEKSLEEEKNEAEEEFREAEDEVKKEIAQIEARVEELEQKRVEVNQKVDPEYLAVYERVLRRHQDRAIVAVEDGICQGCYMSVTPQMINTIMIGDEIVQCRSCQRILYLKTPPQ